MILELLKLKLVERHWKGRGKGAIEPEGLRVRPEVRVCIVDSPEVLSLTWSVVNSFNENHLN